MRKGKPDEAAEIFICGDCFGMLREDDPRRQWTPVGVRQMQVGELCAFHLATGAIPVPGASTWVRISPDEAKRYVGALSRVLEMRRADREPIDEADAPLVAKLALQILIAEESWHSHASIAGAVDIAHNVVRRVKGRMK